MLTTFIDASHMLPVHLHADDATAQRLEGQPNGKTEAWHILWAAPGATALIGTKPGVDGSARRDALLAEDYDRVMHRLPVRSGETIYVPGGTLHSFGPDTLIHEIEQTSNIQQHAMPWRMPSLALRAEDGAVRQVCCASPFFALERWGVDGVATLTHRFQRPSFHPPFQGA